MNLVEQLYASASESENPGICIEVEAAAQIERQAAQIESLRQQLADSQKREAEAIAACKVKDDILSLVLNDFPARQKAAMKEALAIQPDDSALEEWLGQPITKVIHYDEVGMPHTVHLNIPLYKPKGLK